MPESRCCPWPVRLLILLAAYAVVGGWSSVFSADWRLALPGWRYEFPRDHLPHRDFKTEWWYFTGNVATADGRRFGYQLTFFRQGLRSPGKRAEVQSRFVVDDLKFAHFAVTDVQTGRFHFGQKLSRGAFGEAGFEQVDSQSGDLRLAWIDDWQLGRPAAPRFALQANHGDVSIRFDVADGKPWAIHGTDGVSQKADGEGRASHYYSGTRLPTSGTLTLEGKEYAVRGESWFDHEWASNQLTAEQAGWDWFSLQFEDGTELMLYQLRLKGDAGSDPNSSASFIAADGSVRHLRRDDYTLKPLETWVSPQTQARYPLAWEITVPSLDLRARVSTPVRAQELTLAPIAYWEGLVDARATRAGRKVKGHGYMELTGYAGALVGLAE